MEYLSLFISITAVVLSLIFNIITAVSRSRNKDSKETTSLTTVIVKLENIGNGITEIKTELTNLKNEVSENRERIVKVEESVKQAHKRLDSFVK